MGWLIFTFCVLIYLFIGGFWSGAIERELSPTWVFFWPAMLLILICCVIAKIPVELGKKHYIKITKWFEDHL